MFVFAILDQVEQRLATGVGDRDRPGVGAALPVVAVLVFAAFSVAVLRYYAALDRVNGRPYATLICAGSDVILRTASSSVSTLRRLTYSAITRGKVP